MNGHLSPCTTRVAIISNAKCIYIVFHYNIKPESFLYPFACSCVVVVVVVVDIFLRINVAGSKPDTRKRLNIRLINFVNCFKNDAITSKTDILPFELAFVVVQFMS